MLGKIRKTDVKGAGRKAALLLFHAISGRRAHPFCEAAGRNLDTAQRRERGFIFDDGTKGMRGGGRVDLKRTAKRLQLGLAAKGIRVRINRYQHFSPEKGRFLTKYAVIQEGNEEKKRGKTILETYRMIDVVRTLAKLLEDADGDVR